MTGLQGQKTITRSARLKKEIELFFRYSWDDYGTLQPHLVGCLAGSWVLICLTLIKGIQSYGKVAYVITLSPYFVLTFLLSKYSRGHISSAYENE